MLKLPFLHLCAWTLSSGRIGVTLCNDECRPHCRSCQKVTDSTIKDSYAGFFLKANWRDKFAWNQRLTVCPYHVCENSSAIVEGRELLDMPWAFNRNWLGDCTSFSTPPIPSELWQPLTFLSYLTTQTRKHRCSACNILTWIVSQCSAWRSFYNRSIGTPATKINECWT